MGFTEEEFKRVVSQPRPDALLVSQCSLEQPAAFLYKLKSFQWKSENPAMAF